MLFFPKENKFNKSDPLVVPVALYDDSLDIFKVHDKTLMKVHLSCQVLPDKLNVLDLLNQCNYSNNFAKVIGSEGVYFK